MEDNQLIQVNPNVLIDIAKSNRSDWNYETYVDTGLEAVTAKGYSQWIIGMLAYEVQKKWGGDKDFAKAIGINVDSLRVYRFTYKNCIEKDNTFVPPTYIPWGVLHMAAKTDNPVETIKRLEENNNITIESAYRDIKTHETGFSPPRKPRVRLHWNDETHMYDLDIPEEDIKNIDWQKFRTRLVDVITSE